MSKNILQEFCQKNKLPLPVYLSSNLDKQIPKWQSKCVIHDKEVTSDIHTNKISAEQNAAQLMYDQLLNCINNAVEYPDEVVKHVFMIDVTTFDTPINYITKLTNYKICHFVSNTHKKYDNTELFNEIPNSLYLMTFKVSEWIALNKFKSATYYICSKNKSADVLVNIINKSGNVAIYFNKPLDLINYINISNEFTVR